MPELIIVVFGLVFWAVPVIAGMWALLTLLRLRSGQLDMLRRLDTIERLVQRG